VQVAKMNRERHEALQGKLKTSHLQITNLEKLHDVIADQQAVIEEDEQRYGEAVARIADMQRLNALRTDAKLWADVVAKKLVLDTLVGGLEVLRPPYHILHRRVLSALSSMLPSLHRFDI
jgi:hypothetical protein